MESAGAHILYLTDKLGWLTTNNRRLYFASIIIYKILRFRQPEYLTPMFANYTPKEIARGEVITRELATPELEKWNGYFSLQVQRIKSWNSISSSIRFLSLINSFKTGLFKYLKNSSHICMYILGGFNLQPGIL